MNKKDDYIIGWCVYCKDEIKIGDKFHGVNGDLYCDYCYKILRKEYDKTIHYDDEYGDYE